MKIFNNYYYILGNDIISKDYKKIYKLPLELISYLMSNFDFVTSDCFDYDFYQFLIENNILIDGEDTYYPFVKNSLGFSKYRLFIQLTERCNLNCKHCYIGKTNNKGNFFNITTSKKLLEEAVDLGIYDIDLTGGELFCEDYIFDLLGYADNLPIAIGIFTNLTLLSSEDIIRLSKFKCVKSITTSLDYFTKNKHDDFRGCKGSFEKTINNIIDLNRLGKSVTVNTMILPDNHNDIIKMINFFSSKKIDIHLDRVIMKGNAVHNIDFFKTEELFDDVEFMASCIKMIGKEDEILSFIKNDSCGVGDNLIFVDKNGRFQLCPGLTENISSKYFMGNNLIEAINSTKNFSIGCFNVNCKYYNLCSHGCRERALEENGNDCSPDNGVCKLISLLDLEE